MNRQINTETSVAALAAFSADGRVYSFHGFLLATRPGELLLVPIGRSTGDLRGIVHACPVPWHEAWAIIDSPFAQPVPILPEVMVHYYPHLALITPYGWVADVIAISCGKPNVRRLMNASGIFFARAGLL